VEDEPMSTFSNRRTFLVSTGVGGASLLLGCGKTRTSPPDSKKGAAPQSGAETSWDGDAGASDEPEVTAVEDLMREHGVIRRALVVCREAAGRLHARAMVPADALRKTATLFRTFAEDYHERKLEEAFIFPALSRAGGAAAKQVETLIAQHNRGREITDYVIAVTTGAITTAHAGPLAGALDAFARMYDAHAAIEDTLVFPAWKATMSAHELDEIGDRFEDIEHETFGKNGYDDAVARITGIETSLGIELATMTAPSPPRP
jgi:hemerythrin-like domain-containing protein